MGADYVPKQPGKSGCKEPIPRPGTARPTTRLMLGESLRPAPPTFDRMNGAKLPQQVDEAIRVGGIRPLSDPSSCWTADTLLKKVADAPHLLAAIPRGNLGEMEPNRPCFDRRRYRVYGGG